MSLEALLETVRELNPALGELNKEAEKLETTVERIDRIGSTSGASPLPGGDKSGAQPFAGSESFVGGVVKALVALPTRILSALTLGRSEGASGGRGGFQRVGDSGAIGGLVSGQGSGGGAFGSPPPKFQPGPPTLQGGIAFGTGPGSGIGAQRITAGDQLVANQIAGLREDLRASSRESASARASR